MTKYSISDAHRITGKSRTTITKHIAAGKLSCEEDEQGNNLIDASELMRVYNDECDFSRARGDGEALAEVAGVVQGVQPVLSTLKAQLDKEVAERERERAQLQRQIDNLQDALKLAQEGQNKAMLLLEHRSSGGGEWEKAIKALEERIANQEEGTKQQLAEAVKQAKRAGKQEVLSKPWWQTVFAKA